MVVTTSIPEMWLDDADLFGDLARGVVIIGAKNTWMSYGDTAIGGAVSLRSIFNNTRKRTIKKCIWLGWLEEFDWTDVPATYDPISEFHKEAKAYRASELGIQAFNQRAMRGGYGWRTYQELIDAHKHKAAEKPNLANIVIGGARFILTPDKHISVNGNMLQQSDIQRLTDLLKQSSPQQDAAPELITQQDVDSDDAMKESIKTNLLLFLNDGGWHLFPDVLANLLVNNQQVSVLPLFRALNQLQNDGLVEHGTERLSMFDGDPHPLDVSKYCLSAKANPFMTEEYKAKLADAWDEREYQNDVRQDGHPV